jgi:hypothetical protein
MSATIKNMEFIKVDVLNVDQLEIGDLIQVDDDIVQVCEIVALTDGYVITYSNDFGEKDLIEVDDYATFDLFILNDN